MNIKLFNNIIIFLIVFVAISLIIDVYYFDRVVSKDPDDKGQIAYSDFRVFWSAAYDIYHHIMRQSYLKGRYNVFRHFWFLDSKVRSKVAPLARPGAERAVYKKDVEFYQFRYSPFIAFIMIPLGKITPPANALIIWYILLNVTFLVSILLMNNQLNKDFKLSSKHQYLVLWIVFLMSLRFYFMNIALGQTDIMVAFLFMLFLIVYIKNKDLFCGILFALIFQLKPFYLPILIYFLFTGRIKIIISTFIALICFLFMPAYMLGFEKTIALLRDWIDILGMSVSSQVFNVKNQSLTYAIASLLLKAKGLKNLFAYPQYLTYVISAALSLCTYAIMAWTKKMEGKNGEKKYEYLELSVLIIVSLLFSPIAWESHFICLIIPAAAAIYFALHNDKKIIPIAALSIFFVLSCVIGTDLTKYIIGLKSLHFTNIGIGTIFLAFALVYSYRQRP